MSVIRSFIAIDLSYEIYNRLDEEIARLRELLKGMPVRWVPTRNIHLTLKFLGEVSERNIEVLRQTLETETKGKHPFEISIGGLGAYPNIRRPRVIWIGVKSPPELIEFQRSLDIETARLGYPQEKRGYSPHLTLGRISRTANAVETRAIGEILENCQVGFLGAIRIETIQLYRSDLKPTGSEYRVLYSAQLLEDDTSL